MSKEIVPQPDEVERFKLSKEIRPGTWVWVYDGEPDANNEVEGWFGCVTHIGSNYLLVKSPHTSNQGYSYNRIHFDELQDVIEVEEDPEKVIAEHVAEHRAQVKALLGKAHKLLQDLGLASRSLPAGEVPQSESTSALAIASQAIDVKKHKNALIKAKEKTLPEIFKQIKEENEELARWMSAQMLPLRAELGPMKKVVGEIEDRVFTIELYAGLLEDVKQVRKGEPASMDEKLRIMQRRCYMDEECLLDYRVGGMDIKSLNAFDKWLSKKANFERLLPFPRCMVSFQIRRNQKQRVWDGTLGGLFSLMEEGKYDKLTFLYVRNGDRLYRIETGIEFGSTMFPEKDHFVLTEKMWAKRWGGRIDDDKPLMPDREYQDRCKKDDERACSEKAWAKKHKGEKNAWMKNPHRFPSWYDRDSYEPFDPSSVYYDDISEVVEKNIKEFNRIAYVVQGIFDRSEMLHPHPPTKLWDPKGFEAAVELIYDHSSALNPSAEPPSVEDYIRECNTGLRTGSATIGQEDFWERQQAEIYNRDWRVKHEVSHHRPYGNDGPGYLAKIARWYPKQKKAAFRWTRERYRDRYVYGKGYIRDPIPCSTKVPAAKLFNVDAYKPGDFRQFFQDPRTRAQYLKWVCLLLDSEKYHAGKLKIGKDK